MANYLCTYTCLRALDDKRGMNRDMKLTEKQRETVIEMALRGESPVKFIEQCGINNPSCTWWNLKKYLSKNEPETYSKLPDKFKGVMKKLDIPEKPAAVEVPEGPSPTCCQPARPSGVTVPEQLPEKKIGGLCPPPDEDNKFIFQTVAVRNKKLGTFYYDEKHGTIDWRHPYGEEISLYPEDYRLLRDSIDMILHTLGVEP